MSSTRIVDPRTKRRYHPHMGKVLIGPQGRGGPVPQPPERQKPVNPPLTLPNPLAGLTDALTSGVRTLLADYLGAGQVLVGVLLILGGVLLATGQAGRGLRTGVRLASRGRLG